MAKNRNELISDIVVALGGDPSGATRNDLLRAWRDSLPWTPVQLKPALWLDASDATTISESLGFVSEWRDKSGSGNDAYQVAAASQPQTGVDTIGGKNAITFSNDFLVLDPSVDFSQYKSQELFVVVQANDDGNNKAFFTQYDGASNCFSHHYKFNSMKILFFARTGQLNSLSTPESNLTSDLIYSAYANSTEIAVKISQAVSYTTLSIPKPLDNATSQVGIGGRSTGLKTLNGKIGELVFVPSALTADDRYRMEGYLSWKWGLESLLPAGHPYEFSPP